MNRGTFIAIFVGLLAAAGLGYAVANGSDSESEAAATATGSDEATSSRTESTPVNADGESEEAEAEEVPAWTPENLGPAGTLTDIETWLQTDATSLEEFDGQVRIVQFWTFSCYNCTNTIPHLQDIYATHHDAGLEIIGVHAPEFSHEANIDNVANAAVDLGVTWPIAIDNNKTNFRTWQPDRRFWPRTFVVDQNGDIRFNRIGEGKYDELEETVAWLLENGP